MRLSVSPLGKGHMILLLPGHSKNFIRAYQTNLFGVLYTPRRPANGLHALDLPFACDNECYTRGDRFDFDYYLRFLERMKARSGKCLFVTVPDVVGNADATMIRWHEYARPMQSVGLPLAFVAQDGLENLPRFRFDALFIGGTDEYKLGPTVRWLIQDARRARLWVHVGRVNSIKRARYFWQLGADSIDGTDLVFRPNQYLPKWIREMEWQAKQKVLIEVHP